MTILSVTNQSKNHPFCTSFATPQKSAAAESEAPLEFSKPNGMWYLILGQPACCVFSHQLKHRLRLLPMIFILINIFK